MRKLSRQKKNKKGKIVLFSLFFLLFNTQAFTQTPAEAVDSLNRVLRTTHNDTTKVNALIFLARHLSTDGNFNEAVADTKEALALAQKANYKKGIANTYNTIGVIYVEQANYAEALKNYLVALQIREEIADKIGVSSSYINIGNIALQQSNYPEALKNYLVALQIAEEINNKGIMANAYGSIANVYASQGNNEEALKNDFIALKIRQEKDDKHGILLCYLDIGNVYEQEGNYQEALKNYVSAMEQSKATRDIRSISYSYVCIGNIYFRQGNYTEALKNNLLALEIQRQVGDKYGIAYSFIQLGKIYTRTHELITGQDYLTKGLTLSKENRSKDQIKDAYGALSELDSVMGNYKQSLQYYRLYSIVKDSIFNEGSNRQISQLKIQYETEKKDKQIKTQTLQLQNQTLQNRVLEISVAISLMVIGIIALLFYLFFLRNKKRKEEYERMLVDLELTVLRSQLNPHFVSNSLSTIKTFIDQEPGKASQFISKFARLIRRVLEQNEQPFISLKEELETAVLYMQIESLRLRYEFEYQFDIDPSVDREELMVPPLILQPTIENAIWHGLARKNEGGYIKITIKMEDGLLKFIIEDNGVGQSGATKGNIPPGDKKSFGLSITRKRIEVLSKELKREGYMNLTFLDGRTVAEIAFPVDYS